MKANKITHLIAQSKEFFSKGSYNKAGELANWAVDFTLDELLMKKFNDNVITESIKGSVERILAEHKIALKTITPEIAEKIDNLLDNKNVTKKEADSAIKLAENLYKEVTKLVQ